MRALEAEVVDVIWKAIQPLASTRSLTAVRDPARTQQIVATSGWKWSVAVEAHGIPIGWAIDGANRNDIRLLEPTLDAVDATGLLVDIDTLHLDRGYDYPVVRERLARLGMADLNIQRRGTKVPGVKKQPVRLGLRWIVEATNSWWSNYGQLRRNTDRRSRHRHAALCLATTVLIVGKLIAWRNRWSPA